MLIKDVIEIPRQVHKGDFVLKLTQGIERASATLADYVVTPELAVCFDQALTLIGASLEGNTSKAAYLHGSFGSGKSHFMAVLHLLLGHNVEARSIPELAPVLAKHARWLEGKKLLLVPLHLIGALSMESSVLGGYVERVRRLHPDTRPPGVYLSGALLEDARRLLGKMGPQEFFRHLNEPAAGSAARWGKLVVTWDQASFERAAASPLESPEHSRLVSDLVGTLFSAYAEVSANLRNAYVDLDKGLSLVSRHAKELQYDGVILFLDELILWLASHLADQEFVAREAQKVAKLVESGNAARPIPIVGFIARQRDLSELVGDHVPGAQRLSFKDLLKWWEGRFDKITLEDRNLPAIANRRLLKPKSAEAKLVLDRAFDETTRVREDVLNVLQTRDADRAQFRDIYPFSPALVKTLIALSAALQRERTALKVMLQLLVNQRETLQVGDLVPVGDLYDVIAEGDEPLSEEMRSQFDNAKQLYNTKLLPLLEQEHQVRLEQLEALERDGAEVPEALAGRLARFRRDDRLVKTLLLSALVPEVESFRNLTASKLAALNHGTVRVAIPGTEGKQVLNQVRKWAGQVGELHVGEDAGNPTISLQLSGVDTESILEAQKAYDNAGNRRSKIRQVLFQQLGLQAQDSLYHTLRFPWRGTEREVDVVYGNVRDTSNLPDSSLEARGDVWKLVLDFPFDDPGHGPADDLRRVEAYRTVRPATRTVCVIPAFLSTAAQANLGRLVVLDHILVGVAWENATRHLSAVERTAARTLMENQQGQLRQQLIQTLECAYGIAPANDAAVDRAHGWKDFYLSLDPSFNPRPPVGANLRDAFGQLLDQMLSSQFPAHPVFEEELRLGALKKVLEEVRRALDSPDRRVVVEKPNRPLMRQIALPLKLGEMGEAPFILGNHWLDHFEKRRAAAGGPLTVRMLRAWTDEPRPMGLPRAVQDLLILIYAEQTGRAFFLRGAPVDGQLGSLDDETELREQRLPAQGDYELAVKRAGAILGLGLSPLLNVANVAQLEGQCREKAESWHEPARELVEELGLALTRFGFEAGGGARMKTARAADGLLKRLRETPAGGIASALATTAVATSEQAMGSSLAKATELLQRLRESNWQLLVAALALPVERMAGVTLLRQRLQEGLTLDELAVALEPRLRQLQDQATQLLAEATRTDHSREKPRGTDSPAGAPLQTSPGGEPPPGPGMDWGLRTSGGLRPVSTATSGSNDTCEGEHPEGSRTGGKAGPGVSRRIVADRRAALDLEAARAIFKEVESRLAEDRRNRLSLEWTVDRLEEES